MIFSPDLCAKVLDGTKTQTRRPVKVDRPCKYVVGNTYAVQPGRGKPGAGRIRILSVSRVSMAAITRDDAIAEGFADGVAFFDRWHSLYPSEPECCADAWRIEFELIP